MDFFVDFDAFDDDAEVLEVIDHGFPRRVYDRADYFHTMDDLPFFKRFRLTKYTVLNLLPLLEHQLEHFHNRNHSISPINQLLVALGFYSAGSHILTIAYFIGIHAATATRIIRKVSMALSHLAPIYIKLPTTPDHIKEANNAFFDIASFPNIIGAIDGTHVKIQSPEDSAYALKKILLTPVVNPRGEAEQLYNESHIRSKGVIEKLFGIWK